MNEKTLIDIKKHAEQEFGDGSAPRESCGVVIVKNGKETYIPCRNLAKDPTEQFRIHHEDLANAEDQGEIVCIVHSHPYMPAVPSESDLFGCEQSGLPWLIVSWPIGIVYEFEPSGYKAPLIGRKFVHGIFDCYTIIRDYYKEVLGIDIPDFDRDVEWWHKGQNMYVDNFGVAGFVEVPGGLDNLKLHDVVMMQVQSPVINHAGVYVGDNTLLHHFMGRLSSRDVLGHSLRRSVVKVVRHRRLIDA